MPQVSTLLLVLDLCNAEVNFRQRHRADIETSKRLRGHEFDNASLRLWTA